MHRRRHGALEVLTENFLKSLKLNFAILFLVTLCAVCARSARADDRVRLALSVQNVVFLPFYYARDTKIFDRHGLNVELIQMRSDLQLAGLVSGEIDYTPSVGPAGTAIANGLPIKALAILYRAPLFSLVSPPGGMSVKDLEGKKVAVSRIGSESHRYGSLMLEHGGADPKKVTFIQTGSTTISLAAIQQGTVNAAVLSPPFTGMMAERDSRFSRGAARWPRHRGSVWLPIVRSWSASPSKFATCCAPCAM